MVEAATQLSDQVAQLLHAGRRRLRVFEIHTSPDGPIIRAYQPGVVALVPYTSKLAAALMAVPALTWPATGQAGGDGCGLTGRELDVLYLLGAACPSSRIATELGISVSTVHHHKRRIYAKLGAHNQAHAVANALRLSLLRLVIRLPATSKRLAGPSIRIHARTGSSTAERVQCLLNQHDIPGTEAGVSILVDPEFENWAAAARSGARVVVASAARRADLADSLAHGVTIVPADRIDDLLVPAVEAAAHGYMMIDTAEARGRLAAPESEPAGWPQPDPVALTRREREIVTAIAAGHSTKQTARLLGISTRTVENLQGNLFRKLGVHSRTAMLGALGGLDPPGN